MDSWAASGATPLKFSATVSPRLARWTSMVPEPAMVDMNGSTTVIAKAVATAASTALPPPARVAAPPSGARGCSATTMPRWASGVCLVTTRRERIMRPSGSAGRHVLRDVDEALAGEEHVPALWIHPHLGGVALDGGPVAAGDLLHLGLVGAHGHRRAQAAPHLLLVPARPRPPRPGAGSGTSRRPARWPGRDARGGRRRSCPPCPRPTAASPRTSAPVRSPLSSADSASAPRWAPTYSSAPPPASPPSHTPPPGAQP